MKKFIKSSLLLFATLVAIAMSGCDALQNFLFDLPVTFTVNAHSNPDGTASGQDSYCLDTENETYQDYADKLNSITFVEAHIVTDSLDANAQNIQGDGTLRLFEGTSSFGTLLLTYTDNNIKLADHFSPNGYKIQLNQADIDKINTSLANGNRCFYADYQVNEVSGTATHPYFVRMKIDVLFQMDTSL
jgi:hypothetical protein